MEEKEDGQVLPLEIIMEISKYCTPVSKISFDFYTSGGIGYLNLIYDAYIPLYQEKLHFYQSLFQLSLSYHIKLKYMEDDDFFHLLLDNYGSNNLYFSYHLIYPPTQHTLHLLAIDKNCNKIYYQTFYLYTQDVLSRNFTNDVKYWQVSKHTIGEFIVDIKKKISETWLERYFGIR